MTVALAPADPATESHPAAETAATSATRATDLEFVRVERWWLCAGSRPPGRDGRGGCERVHAGHAGVPPARPGRTNIWADRRPRLTRMSASCVWRAADSATSNSAHCPSCPPRCTKSLQTRAAPRGRPCVIDPLLGLQASGPGRPDGDDVVTPLAGRRRVELGADAALPCGSCRGRAPAFARSCVTGESHPRAPRETRSPTAKGLRRRVTNPNRLESDARFPS